jgi:Spy/CpxP family protein refolding chaperone
MRLPKRNRLALMAALGLGACTTTAGTRMQLADAQAADDQAEAELREHHRHQHRGGVMQFIAMGLDTVGPGEAARPQVELLQRDLYACMAPAGEAKQRLQLTVAEGVAAGAVDLAKVDAIIGQLDAAAAALRDCSVTALNQLHAVLSPVERAELVEKVQAHWEVWGQVNSDEESAGRGPRGRLGALTREVSLTPDQVERASAALHTALSGQAGRFDRSKVDADVQAFAAAFEAESFDARSVTPYANSSLASHGATRMAIFYETVTPLLTPGQRAELAVHLRARAARPAISAN